MLLVPGPQVFSPILTTGQMPHGSIFAIHFSTNYRRNKVKTVHIPHRYPEGYERYSYAAFQHPVI